jgi:TRAP-type uncharacterized transport system fused permease subunit
MGVGIVTSFFRRESWLTPLRILRALEQGGRSVVSVAAACATAGILVGVVNLTGLGLKLSGIILDLGGGSLFLTLLLAALVLLVLGLALPISASYIVAAVITAPALVKMGVPEPAAHMFIFYYALLSEVTPPTALSCMAVSAITHGNPYKTMWITWRYALPAFVVPFMFAAPDGMHLLLVGTWPQVVLAVVTSLAGIAALVGAAGGRLLHDARPAQRLLLGCTGFLLVYPTLVSDTIGLALFAVVLGWQLAERRSLSVLRAAESDRPVPS